jgi:hypothetical protein
MGLYAKYVLPRLLPEGIRSVEFLFKLFPIVASSIELGIGVQTTEKGMTAAFIFPGAALSEISGIFSSIETTLLAIWARMIPFLFPREQRRFGKTCRTHRFNSSIPDILQ